MRARLATAAWALAAGPAARAFRRGLEAPGRAQARLLRATLEAGRDTAYGRAHGFASALGASRPDGDLLRAFQDAVPVVGWDGVAPYVDRIAAGEANVLTAEPVRLLEPTGGSSGGTKLVPYTRTLQGQIRTAVAPWIADLFRHAPGAARGPAYWSVSPGVPHATTEGGVPVGFEDDGAYLSPLHRALARATLAAPSALRHVRDVEAFRYATLRHLVAHADLALVSVWNPTFLELLLRPLRSLADRLAHDLERGTLSVEAPDSVRVGLARDPARAAELRRLAASTLADADLCRALWPRLALVSAWADAHAAGPAARLEALLPHAAHQPKGLIATEGVVTIPLWGHDGAAPAVTSTVIELEPEGGGRPLFLHEVEEGRYSVLLTTGGGLTRYRLGDVVEVVGRVEAAPLLRFVGRAGPVSDLVGEKLHGAHVEAALRGLDLDGFALVAPDGGARPARYVLFWASTAPADAVREAVRGLEAALSDNVHYAHARRLGQLGPAAAFRVEGDAEAAYLDGCVALGQRLGDVKPAALHRDGGWASRLEGRFVEAPTPATRPRRP